MLASLLALLPFLAITSASPIAKRANKILIESGRTPGQCLSVQGGRTAVSAGQLGNNTPVVTIACAVASFWDISKGSGSVLVSGTIYALDIGLTPQNNGPVKIYQTFPTSPRQTWFLTDDNRIAITGGSHCLDLGNSGIQTYQCTAGNTNQVWNAQIPVIPPIFLPSVPLFTVVRDTLGLGSRIHPVGRDDLCVMVTGGKAGVGSLVGISACVANNAPFSELQRFAFSSSSADLVRLFANPTLCLDAGSIPANGIGAKLWTCGDFPQQKWEFVGNQLRTSNNQCLDIKKESLPDTSAQYVSFFSLITWECSTNADPFQAFSVLK